MILRQILNPDLGCASYLIADPGAGVAAVVDPRADITPYLEAEAEYGVRITDVIETHNHADHVSGRPGLLARGETTARIHRLANAAYDHTPFDDGDAIDIGSARLTIIHTPGHRPEHSSVLVTDTAESPEPVAVLTGDSLFVGDVARPDLAVEPRAGAGELHRSLERLAELDDAVAVLPAHIGGSLCGSARMSTDTSSTIGEQRRYNEMFAEADEAAFVDELTSGLSPQPPNFKRIVAINQGPLPPAAAPLARISAAAVRNRIGAALIDGRGTDAFDAGHIPGSVVVPAELTGFGTKAAWIVDPEADVILIADDDAQAERMAAALHAVAVDRTLGLDGGIAAWTAAGFELDSVSTATARELEPLWRAGEVQLLDVRERDEWEEFHIPGSVNAPYHELDEGIGGLDPSRPIATVCSGGVRSGIAAGILLNQGLKPIHVTEGVGVWQHLGFPIEEGEQ